MANVQVLPVQVWTAGTRSFGPVAIDDAVQSIELAVRRCTTADVTIWPLPTDTIGFDIEFQIGGVWRPWFNGSSGGGIAVSPKTGKELALMMVGGPVPAGTGRFIRGSVTLSSAIRTGADLTVT